MTVASKPVLWLACPSFSLPPLVFDVRHAVPVEAQTWFAAREKAARAIGVETGKVVCVRAPSGGVK